jgi:hypothetical protein
MENQACAAPKQVVADAVTVTTKRDASTAAELTLCINTGISVSTKRDASNTATLPPCINTGSSVASAPGPLWRRARKQPMEDDRTKEERAPISINLTKVRGLTPFRLIAVGVFLSVVSITSKQLVNYMKNVWNIRGPLESHQLADRRFMLEFALEGDYEHVTRGGPWRYQGDTVLIRKLDDGEDPNSVRFELMPIWAQFTRIPFYLLSKQLARKLGKKLGEYITTDNNTRGNICKKILHARVNLPIARPLQRWITQEDEFSNEEVLVTILYERLPSFCRCCGVIGHQEDACDLPATLRRRRYSKDIGVPATHVDDPRKCFLPELARDNGRAIHMDLPWRNIAALGSRSIPARAPQLALVSHIAEGVEKLSVQDGLTTEATATLTITDKTNPSQVPTDETEHANDKKKSTSKDPTPTKTSNGNAGVDDT